jgi:hypothetical protein
MEPIWSFVELGALTLQPPGIFRFLTCSGKGLIGRAKDALRSYNPPF